MNGPQRQGGATGLVRSSEGPSFTLRGRPVHLIARFCDDHGVTEPALSAALVAYIWGDRTLPWPSERPEALTEEQRAYLPKIKSVIATAFADDPTDETLSAMAVRVESAVRTAHPELTEEAVRAIGNYYSFCWK